MANDLLNVSGQRFRFGGTGYIAGNAPGILSVEGSPAQRPIELRLREDNRNLVARTWSNSTGTYLFANLDPTIKYDIIARDEPNYVYNDVIVSSIWPWTDYELIMHGPAVPLDFRYDFSRTYELTGGVLPYAIDGSSNIPEGVTVTLDDRLLTITAASDPGEDLTVVITDSSTVTKSFTVTTLVVDTGNGVRPQGGAVSRYWRINMTASENSGTSTGYMNIGIFSVRATVGGENQAYGAGGVSSESSVYVGMVSGFAWNKLNADAAAGNYWHSTNQAPPWWSSYDFGPGNEKEVTEIAMCDVNFAGRGPTDFSVQVSANGTDWVTVKEFSGITGWSTGTVKVFSLLPGDGLTTSLLHFEGADGATSITDEITRTWTRYGTGAEISTDNSRFGTSSLKVVGADSNFNCPAGILEETDLFCLDGWMWCDPAGGAGGPSTGPVYTLCGQGGNGNNTDQYIIVGAAGNVQFIRATNIGGEGALNITSAAGAITLGAWNHIMLTFDGSRIRLYANGVGVGSVAATKGWINTGYPFTLGYQIVQSYPGYRKGNNGFIDEFRIVIGHPVITGNVYDVPSGPY